MNRKIVPTPVGNAPRPNPTRASSPGYWTFSFRFFKQIAFFGLSESKSTWFVSLFQRLADLSKYTIDEVHGDRSLRSHLRYHQINWDHKNVPIKLSDLNWVKADYLNNEDEYPFYQFQVSKALGRIVGFWDEKSVFNVVLLDPLHNIQPSKDYAYKVDPCSPLRCEYTILLETVDDVRRTDCKDIECDLRKKVSLLNENRSSTNVAIISMRDDDFSTVTAFLESRGQTFTAFLEEQYLSVSSNETA